MIRTAVKFGTFVVVCLFFTGYLAFTIGNLDVRDPLGRDTYSVTATFDDVTGLLVDDNVKVAGVVVGKVTSVRTEAGRAIVSFNLDNDHAGIPKDSKAAIRWRNLIGQRYVYLYPGTSAEALQDGDLITETASVIDLGELFNRLGPIVGAIDPAEVNDFLDTITTALDGREDSVGKALDDLAVLTSGLAGRDDAIAAARHQPRHGRADAEPTRRADRADAPEPHHPVGHVRRQHRHPRRGIRRADLLRERARPTCSTRTATRSIACSGTWPW